jgi:hypothetical protein
MNDEFQMTNGVADVKRAVDDPGSAMVRVPAARGSGRQAIVVQGPSSHVKLGQTLKFLKYWRTGASRTGNQPHPSSSNFGAIPPWRDRQVRRADREHSTLNPAMAGPNIQGTPVIRVNPT